MNLAPLARSWVLNPVINSSALRGFVPATELTIAISVLKKNSAFKSATPLVNCTA